MIIIADNLQITHPTVKKALEAMDPEPIQEMVKKCEAAGAQAIDINSGPLPKKTENTMAFLVKTIQEISDLPILIDTVNPNAIKAGLQAIRKKAIINGFSLEPVKLETILPLAKTFDADIIGYLLYPDGHVPHDAAERLNVAVELYKAFEKSGIEPDRLIIDPIVPPIMWQNGNFQAMEVLSVIKMLPDILGFPVKTIAALSNLTTGQSDRNKKLLLEKTYVPMLALSGLNYILMNIFHTDTVSVIRTCKSLMMTKIFTWEEVY